MTQVNKCFSVLVTGILLSTVSLTMAAKPMKVLLLSGKNNHGWQETTPALVKIYEGCSRFDVDVLQQPETMTTESLAGYDVIVSNWTNFPGKDRVWGKVAEQAFLDFVKQGRGFVLFHAASASFSDWQEFQDLIGATWGQGTGHGSIHRFLVEISDTEHPITKGMSSFSIQDELWHNMQVYPTAQIICRAWSSPERGGTGEMEPVAYWTQFGKGRCFHLVLGHDVNAMESMGWHLLMQRGTQWAATGSVDIEIPIDLSKQLAQIDDVEWWYDHSLSRPIEELVHLSTGFSRLRKRLTAEIEKKLSQDVSDAYKSELLNWLSVIGSDNQLPAMSRLLVDPELTERARMAIERIPGPAATAVLRQALPELKGRTLAGTINTLGLRRDKASVDVIAAYVTDSDKSIADAAVIALGKIGTPEAFDILSKQVDCQDEVYVNALLECADHQAQHGGVDQALSTYQDIYHSTLPAHLRQTALIGIVRYEANTEKVNQIIMKALTGDDLDNQHAAVQCIGMLGVASLQYIADCLGQVPVHLQAQLITRLSESGDKSLLPGLKEGLKSPEQTVRLAALKAVGILGDAGSIVILTGHLANASAAEKEVIRSRLVQLSGKDVDKTMLKMLEKTSDLEIKQEMGLALATREYTAAIPVFLSLAQSQDKQLSRAAFEALNSLADMTVFDEVMAILEKTRSSQTRQSIETLLVAIVERTGMQNEMYQRVLTYAKKTTSSDVKASLLRVLGHFGGDPALELLRETLAGKDSDMRLTAIRVLSDWPDDTALKDLLHVAEKSDLEIEQILALRGFAQVLGKVTNPQDTVLQSMLKEAMDIAKRPEEKKVLLSGLAKVPSPMSLELATAAMKQDEAKNEASVAVVGIAKELIYSHPDLTRVAIQEVLNAEVLESIHSQASTLLRELNNPINLALIGKADSPDGLSTDGVSTGDQAGIDGEYHTYWDEEDGKDLYRYRVSFPQRVEISCLRLTGYLHHNYAPKTFDIIADGNVIHSVTNAVYADNVVTVFFESTKCKTIELKITESYGPSPAIRELELYSKQACNK